jgi:hypothetical protein
MQRHFKNLVENSFNNCEHRNKNSDLTHYNHNLYFNVLMQGHKKGRGLKSGGGSASNNAAHLLAIQQILANAAPPPNYSIENYSNPLTRNSKQVSYEHDNESRRYTTMSTNTISRTN